MRVAPVDDVWLRQVGFQPRKALQMLQSTQQVDGVAEPGGES